MPKDQFYVAHKQADWHLLKQWADEGLIRLVYLDESGFERISPLAYSYSLRGQQQHIPKPQRRGRRINVLGVWEPEVRFDYGLVVGRFTTQRYLPLMQWQADKAHQHLQATGQITVVIQDGASFHRSHETQKHWAA